MLHWPHRTLANAGQKLTQQGRGEENAQISKWGALPKPAWQSSCYNCPGQGRAQGRGRRDTCEVGQGESLLGGTYVARKGHRAGPLCSIDRACLGPRQNGGSGVNHRCQPWRSRKGHGSHTHTPRVPIWAGGGLLLQKNMRALILKVTTAQKLVLPIRWVSNLSANHDWRLLTTGLGHPRALWGRGCGVQPEPLHFS